MIKINLLPVRAAKKKESAIQQIVIFCVSLLLVAAVVMSMYFFKRMQISTTKNDINTANNRINELKAKIGKLEELKTLKEQVKKKLDVLAQLRKNKTGPARRLATMSDITPDQLWLTGYGESGSDIRISGLAYTEELIATFMRSLEASSDYMGVELVVSEQSESGGIKLKRFELVCKLQPTPEPAGPPAPNAPK
ncbi:MAG: PilN domain-containing protein [Deltaproteobacteria bacterium]|nr:PilN domain-containing protein [Deltaproteobacteria bacterium]